MIPTQMADSAAEVQQVPPLRSDVALELGTSPMAMAVTAITETSAIWAPPERHA